MISLTVEGTIVRKPVVRETKAGPVTVITVVHNTRRRDTAGNWFTKGRGLFVEVACWRALGTRVAELKKGDLVTVETDDLNLTSFEGMATLRANARNVCLSLRFDGASSHRNPGEPADQPGDTVVTADGDEYTHAEYAEYTAEREHAPV